MLFSPTAIDFCASRCRLLQCGSDTVALLGRFLPRLGPLANASGPFFGYSAAARYGRSSSSGISPRPPPRGLRAPPQPVERAGARVAALVHVKRAVDLELDGMEAGSRVAVMLGDEAAGIGLIPAHGVAQATQGLFHGLGHRADATGAVAVAEYEFRPWPLVLMAGGGRHGMAIDQHGGAKVPL